MSLKPGRLHPGVGTGAIVTHQDKLLLILRSGAHGAGTWSVPGGWVELWENPLDGAVREVKEETGITVTAIEPLGWTNVVQEGVHAITLWVRCRYIEGLPTVTEPDRCPIVAWVSLPEVERLPLFAPLNMWWPMFKESNGR